MYAQEVVDEIYSYTYNLEHDWEVKVYSDGKLYSVAGITTVVTTEGYTYLVIAFDGGSHVDYERVSKM